MSKQQIGVVGLAVMGKNLAMNMESKGFSVAVYNRSSEKTDELLAEAAGKNFVGAYSIEIRAVACAAAQNYDYGQSRQAD